MTKTHSTTPIRRALRDGSALRAQVKDGLGAVSPGHREYFAEEIRSAFADSLDADAALRGLHEQENRWDYLLGHAPSNQVIGVEPHSAKEDEIGTVIRKRSSALRQLRTHLRDGERIVKWLWVASGKVHFAKTEKAKLRLDQNGIEFVGTRVLARHLPTATSPTNVRRRRKNAP